MYTACIMIYIYIEYDRNGRPNVTAINNNNKYTMIYVIFTRYYKVHYRLSFTSWSMFVDCTVIYGSETWGSANDD